MTELEGLKHEVEVAEAARCCQYANVKIAPMSSLLPCFQLLAAEDIQIPDVTAQLWTRKKAESYLDGESFEDWLTCIWPQPVTRERDGVWFVPEFQGSWDYRAPKWCFVFDKNDEEGRSLWMQSILNDSFLILLSSVESNRLECSLFRLCGMFVDFATVELTRVAQISKNEDTCLSVIMKLFRAILGLLSPEPFYKDASPEDVDFIAPLQESGAVEFTKVVKIPIAKVITRTFKKPGFWKNLVDEYRCKVGAEETCGRELRRLRRQLEGIRSQSAASGAASQSSSGDGDGHGGGEAASITNDPSLPALRTWSNKYSGWNENLREGALVTTARTAFDIVKALAGNFTQSTPSTEDNKSVLSTLKLSAIGVSVVLKDHQGAKELAQQLGETEAAWTVRSKLSRVEAATSDTVCGWSSVTNLYSALRETYNTKKPEQTCKQVVDSLWSMVEWAVSGAAVSAAQAKGVLTLLKDTLVDSDLKSTLDAAPGATADLQESGKIILSLAAALEFSLKLTSIGAKNQKAPEYANLVLGGVRKFSIKLVMSSEKGRSVANKALALYNEHKNPFETCLREYTVARMTDLQQEMVTATTELKVRAGGAPDGAVWSDAYEPIKNGHEQSITEFFKGTLDKVDSKTLEKQMQKLEKVIAFSRQF